MLSLLLCNIFFTQRDELTKNCFVFFVGHMPAYN